MGPTVPQPPLRWIPRQSNDRAKPAAHHQSRAKSTSADVERLVQFLTDRQDDGTENRHGLPWKYPSEDGTGQELGQPLPKSWPVSQRKREAESENDRAARRQRRTRLHPPAGCKAKARPIRQTNGPEQGPPSRSRPQGEIANPTANKV